MGLMMDALCYSYTIKEPKAKMTDAQASTLWDIAKYVLMPLIAVILGLVWNTRERRKEKKSELAHEIDMQNELEKKEQWHVLTQSVISMKNSIDLITQELRLTTSSMMGEIKEIKSDVSNLSKRIDKIEIHKGK